MQYNLTMVFMKCSLKKKLMKLITFCFLLLFSFSFSQDKESVKIEYNEVVTFTPLIVNKIVSKLYINQNFIYYKQESCIIEKNGNNENPETIILDSNENMKLSEIIIDNKTKKLTENLYENLFLKDFYSVYENQPKMNWELLKGEKKINDYLCKKAQTIFRGRIYTAWYALFIPVYSGPWKFNGAPGLILSVEDSEGIYKWEAKTITFPYKEKDIDFEKVNKKNSKFKRISYEDFDSIRIDVIKEKIKTIKARNKNRDGMGFGFEYSTFQEREPINEWRTQINFN
jgi:GLPGLI family protein